MRKTLVLWLVMALLAILALAAVPAAAVAFGGGHETPLACSGGVGGGCTT